MPTDILIYAIIAGFLVLWLRSLLGTRRDDEPQQRNPFEEQTGRPDRAAEGRDEEMGADFGGAQPRMAEPAKPALDPEIMARINDKDVEDGLFRISLADRNFNIEAFLDNAKEAFALIVEAFAAGDRATLQDLLAQQVYEPFGDAIAAREKRGETVEKDVLSVKEASIRKAWMDKKMAYITLRFVSTETSITRDKDGKLIAGAPGRVSEKIDVWTFGRNTKSGDPRWFLYETAADTTYDKQ